MKWGKRSEEEVKVCAVFFLSYISIKKPMIGDRDFLQYKYFSIHTEAFLLTCSEMKASTSSSSGRKSSQLRADSLHKEATVLWLCGDKMRQPSLMHLSSLQVKKISMGAIGHLIYLVNA